MLSPASPTLPEASGEVACRALLPGAGCPRMPFSINSISPALSPPKSQIRKIRLRRWGTPKCWALSTLQAISVPQPRTMPAFAHLPEAGIGISVFANASSTALKSLPAGFPLDMAPGTFSHSAYLGYLPFVALLISSIIRMASVKRPLRSPCKPSRRPAVDKSWQGEPKLMMSTGGSFAPSSAVMSPTCSISGKWRMVTDTACGSISLAHSGRMQ